MDKTATIFALSSGSTPSGIAVVRVSGDLVREALRLLCGAVPAPRQLALRGVAAAGGPIIDRCLVAFFEAPHSFTGEDCAEFHVHGSRAVVAALLRALGEIPGARQAEAGEFTMRAFLNGKLDLTGAEALSDLILAETDLQRRLALSNADGRQGALYENWRQRLLRGRALVEAELDFSDEADVPGSVSEQVWDDVRALREEMLGHLGGFRAAEIVRDGFKVVILGAPNAGKSSLLNCLAGREVAIVTEEPGTTRDVLEVALDLHGVKVCLADTAGIREKAGKVESIGIDRARAAAAAADLVLVLEDLTSPVPVEVPTGSEVVRIGSKKDIAGAGTGAGYDLTLSSRTGEGIGALLATLAARASLCTKAVGESAVPTRQRHVDLIGRAAAGLDEALDEGAPLEVRVEGLRIAGDRVGRLSGAIGAEEVLGEIFSAFCIGK